MCGFIAARDDAADVNELIDRMAYRGYSREFKGYERTRHGVQMAHYSLPFVNLDPAVAVQPRQDLHPSLFVGEIFNYKELGFETDIECIVKRFLLGGPSAFMDFDGFWTFVAETRQGLIGITDHLGIKPLYYRTDVEAMASEPDVLKEFGAVTPDLHFLSNTMKWGYDPRPNTPWKQIKQVPPGHYVLNGEVKPYWDWFNVKKTDLRTDLTESVQNRLGGQRDVSMLLSGGLDSTIIYGLIKELGRDITAIHVDNGEEDYARLVTEDLIDVKLDDVSLEDAVEIHQTPVDLGSVRPQIAMARKLRDLGFYAVMTGDGADELFGGYRRAAEYDSQYSDTFSELPYYHLPRLDRANMRYTVELRAPFLSPKVIKHALMTPYEKRNGEKKMLKETFADLVPEPILNRTKHALKTEAIRTSPEQQRKINNTIWDSLYG